MKSKQTMFFATKNDLSLILENIEKEFNVEYVETGLFDSKNIMNYSSVSMIPDFGFTKFGMWISFDHRYLVILKGKEILVRDVPQKKGGVKYAIDQMQNIDSIELSSGGVFLEKEKILVAGRTGTVSDTEISNTLYKSLTSKIKKSFKKIDTFYVGPEAEGKLKEGWRLVTNEKLSPEFDLKIS